MERKYYDITSAQILLFYQQKFTIHKQVNNICTSVLVDKELDFDILKKAIQKEYERNDALRLRMVIVDKKPKQYFEEHEEPDIGYLDFRGKTLEQMERKLYKIAHKPITVYGKPMSKVYMMRSYDGKSGIYFVVSHMIMDFWAINVFYKDVFLVYEALLNGTDMPKPLSSFEEQLVEELNYKNTEAYRRDREFWERTLSEVEPIYTHVNGSCVLEKYRKKHKNPNCRHAQNFSLFTKAINVMFLCPKELVAQMEAYCADKKVTMQSLVLLAYRSFYSKVNNREKNISFYSAVARRGTVKEKNSGGTRAMAMPLTTIIEENETFRKACEIINEKLSTIFRHANISAVEIMSLWRKLYNLPQIGGYVSSAVTFQPVKIVAPGGMKVETKWYGNGASGQPLYFTVMDGDGTGALKFYYEYRPHEISLETVKKLHAYMLKALEAGIKNDEITIGELLNIE